MGPVENQAVTPSGSTQGDYQSKGRRDAILSAQGGGITYNTPRVILLAIVIISTIGVSVLAGLEVKSRSWTPTSVISVIAGTLTILTCLIQLVRINKDEVAYLDSIRAGQWEIYSAKQRAQANIHVLDDTTLSVEHDRLFLQDVVRQVETDTEILIRFGEDTAARELGESLMRILQQRQMISLLSGVPKYRTG